MILNHPLPTGREMSKDGKGRCFDLWFGETLQSSAMNLLLLDGRIVWIMCDYAISKNVLCHEEIA